MFIFIFGIIFAIIDWFLYKQAPKINAFWYFFGAFLIMGFQDSVSVDYSRYELLFYQMADSGDNMYKANEYGWAYLYKFFSWGEFWMVVLFKSIVETIIISKLVNKYIKDRKYWILAFLVYYYTFDFMMFTMTGMRQGLAIQLCVLSFIMMDEKKVCYSLLAIFAANTIHSASLIMLPVLPVVYFLYKYPKILNFLANKILLISIPIIFLILNLKRTLIQEILQPIMLQQDFHGLEGYFRQMESVQIVYLLVLYNFVLVCLASYMMSKTHDIVRIIMLFTIISSMSNVIFAQQADLYRAFIYFEIFNVISIPVIVEHFRKKLGLTISMILIIFFLGYSFKTFTPYAFTGGYGFGHYNNYKFIFE